MRIKYGCIMTVLSLVSVGAWPSAGIAAEGTASYVPGDAESSPFSWGTVGNWYKKGTTTAFGQLPTSNDRVYLGYDTDKNGEVDVSETGVQVSRFYIAGDSNQLRIKSGASFETKYTSGVSIIGQQGSSSNCSVYVENNAQFVTRGGLTIGFASKVSGNRLVVADGGSYLNAASSVIVGGKGYDSWLENAGTVNLENGSGVSLIVGTNSFGCVVNDGTFTTVGEVRIGCLSGDTGIITNKGSWTANATSSSSASMYFDIGVNGTGVYYGGADSELSFDNVYNLYLDVANTEAETAGGSIRLEGGSVVMGGTNRNWIRLGANDDTTCWDNGRLTGWGSITSSTSIRPRMWMYGGTVVADGCGAAHDLDLSCFQRVDGGIANVLNGNGWFAVNKGRVLYPAQNTHTDKRRGLGCFYNIQDNLPMIINSLKIEFSANTKTSYLLGELYAADRDDIPSGLVTHGETATRLGIWRAGLSSATSVTAEDVVPFTSATVSVRMDHVTLKARQDAGCVVGGSKIVLYQHDGTANGTWKKVTTMTLDEAEAASYLISGTITPSSEAWNLGWLAVTVEPPKGLSIIFR